MSLDTFLKLNDQINTVLGRYDAWKRGDYEAAKNPIPAELSNSNAGVSLIDFDDSAPSASGPAASGGQAALNDLETLFGPSGATQQTHPPGIAAFSSQFQTSPPTYPQSSGFGGVSAMGHSTGGSPAAFNPSTPPQYHISSSTPSSSSPAGMIRLGTPQLQPQNTGSRVASPSPNYFGATNPSAAPMGGGLGISSTNGISAFGTVSSGSMNAMVPQQQSQQQRTQQPPPAQPGNPSQAQGKDPFADLVGLF